MARPASLKPSSSPILARKKQTGGKKLGLDWEHIELSENHKANTEFNLLILLQLRRELIAAEEAGKYSKVKKLRREISSLQENQLAIHSTFCGGCGYHLHNCRCGGLTPTKSKSTEYRKRRAKRQAIDRVHSILLQVRKEIDGEAKL